MWNFFPVKSSSFIPLGARGHNAVRWGCRVPAGSTLWGERSARTHTWFPPPTTFPWSDLSQSQASHGRLGVHVPFVSSGRSRPFLAALVLSQTIFALVHVPSRLVDGVGGVSLATNLTLVLASGLVFALLYYRTRNLLLVVGVHALLNYPTVVLGSEAVASLVVATLSLVLLVAWPALERRFSVPQTERTVTPTEARPRF